jgi:methionyl aminopeptidase
MLLLMLFLKYGFYDLILYLAVDVTVYHRGFHGDLNETFLIGNVSPEAKKLVQVTSECLLKAINIGKN